MRVQEVCDKHNISHKNVLKHCQRGRFILEGIVYTAEDVSKPDARNAKWEITALDGYSLIVTKEETKSRSFKMARLMLTQKYSIKKSKKGRLELTAQKNMNFLYSYLKIF
ncbi:hypothetical protein P0136_03150 [Lentisphaerota bacterium ZTH]|nr:hypothetical protein JYG24_05715 [Lentisphaerota bacterium]WET06999.1 hypothetical protein P0136_03150 [Lentisphaerota bacterium ZTH]